MRFTAIAFFSQSRVSWETSLFRGGILLLYFPFPRKPFGDRFVWCWIAELCCYTYWIWDWYWTMRFSLTYCNCWALPVQLTVAGKQRHRAWLIPAFRNWYLSLDVQGPSFVSVFQACGKVFFSFLWMQRNSWSEEKLFTGYVPILISDVGIQTSFLESKNAFLKSRNVKGEIYYWQEKEERES